MLYEVITRIHRSNLVGMGILPLQFKPGESRVSHGLDGSETFTLHGHGAPLLPGEEVRLSVQRSDGSSFDLVVDSRIDTANEVQYFLSGGISYNFV